MKVNVIPTLNDKAQRVDNLGRRLVPATFCRDGDGWLALFLCPDCQHRWSGQVKSDARGEPQPSTLVLDRLYGQKRGMCTPSNIVLYAHRRLGRNTCGNPQRPHALREHGRVEFGTLRLICAKCNPGAAAAEENREYDVRHPENVIAAYEREQLRQRREAGLPDTSPALRGVLPLNCPVRRVPGAPAASRDSSGPPRGANGRFRRRD